jgi:hypothetical protein
VHIIKVCFSLVCGFHKVLRNSFSHRICLTSLLIQGVTPQTMSSRAWFEELHSKFGTSREYIDDLHTRRAEGESVLVNVDNETDEDVIATAVQKWVSTRMGVVGQSRLLELKTPWYPPVPVCRTVDIKQQRVFSACDENGLPVLADERNNCSVQDAKVIERFVLLESGPFEKGRAILDMAGMDRLFGEMLTMDRKEFFWCCVHGLMHLVPVQHDVFANCKHSGSSSSETYDKWPKCLLFAVIKSISLRWLTCYAVGFTQWDQLMFVLCEDRSPGPNKVERYRAVTYYSNKGYTEPTFLLRFV